MTAPPVDLGPTITGEAGFLQRRLPRCPGERRPQRLRFYLGAPEPSWLTGAGLDDTRLDQGLALFVSHSRLRRLADVPDWFAATRVARLDGEQRIVPWALDSGAFTEISTYGRWRTDALDHAIAVTFYDGAVSGMEWAAPQDWMCEPPILALTGLTVLEHQRRTVQNYVDLTRWWDGLSPRACPFRPVVQGWTVPDYLRCVQMYGDAGVDLHAHRLVGVGSVCRRQGTGEIADVAGALAAEGLWLHGFGVKTEGLDRYAEHLVSADSMAWSIDARHAPPLPGHTHRTCVSCPGYALREWDRIQDRLSRPRPAVDQLAAFDFRGEALSA